MDKLEIKIKAKLLGRGFSSESVRNNRALIRATIDETIIEVVKEFIVESSDSLCLHCKQEPAVYGLGSTKTLCKKCWNSMIE